MARPLRIKIGRVKGRSGPHVLMVWTGEGRPENACADFGPHTPACYGFARRLLDSFHALETVNPIHIGEVFERLGALLRCHAEVDPAHEGALRGELEKLQGAVQRCGSKWEPIPVGAEIAMVVVNPETGQHRVHGQAGAEGWVAARLAATMDPSDPGTENEPCPT